jgi:hypothetical protein
VALHKHLTYVGSIVSELISLHMKSSLVQAKASVFEKNGLYTDLTGG